MPMSDEIILDIGRKVMERHGGKPSTAAGLEIGRAIEAAARAEEHARCVRLFRDDGWDALADWLKRNPPKGEV